MRRIDHFWFFSKFLACIYLFAGAGLSWRMLQDSHWISASIVAVASVFFAAGHWKCFYWAFATTLALVAVVNILSVFYLFPIFGDQSVRASVDNPLISFAGLTIFLICLGLYLYFNQRRMVGYKGKG